mmetsp:Transcript_33863/g.59710  ORF Transcript_33863/g.59710 Transcript_33863/m.59710 type:complete len:274 (+) Transcript_33863:47-868(+)
MAVQPTVQLQVQQVGQSPPPLPMAHHPKFPPWVPPRGPEPAPPEATATCDCWQWCGHAWKKQRTQSYKQARVYKQHSTWQATSSSQCWQWCGGRWQAHRYKEAQPYRPAWQEAKTSDEKTYWKRWYYTESNRGGGHWYRRSNCWPTGTACSNSPGAPSSSRSQTRLACGLLASEVSDLLFRDITPDDYEMLLQLDESVPRPTASKALVDSLPHASSEDCLGETCSVCLMSFESGDSIAVIPSCKHKFHRGCISKWLLERHRTCPLCGNEVSVS